MGPGLGIIHGTALRSEDFSDKDLKGAGLIWSPRSNDELYGATANIVAARSASIPIAIARDWSPTGSSGMLQEMGYAAARYKFVGYDQRVSMATTVPRADRSLG